MLVIIVLTCAVLVQFLTVLYALRLIRLTGKAYSWILISIALFLMMIRRIIPLYHLVFGDMPCRPDLTNEIFGLLLSIFMFLGIVGIKQIFKARILAEEEARLSAKHIHYLSKYANDFIILLDENFHFIEINERMIDFYGYTREELIGMHASQLRAPETKEEFEGQIKKAMVSGKALFETVHQRKDGSKFAVEINLHAIESEGKKYFQAVIRDISERKQAEEDLRKLNVSLEQRIAERTAELVVARNKAESADRLKSAFLASMSHELRTPLNSIIGFTGIVLQGLAGPLNPEQEKQLGMVRGSARHLLDLINDVLDISKIEAGQLQINSESFDLRRSIEKSVQIVSPMANKKNLQISCNIMEDISEISGDQRRVEQIMINLLTNAVKFTEKGGISIHCRTDGPAIILSVTDTGIGIKPENQQMIFDAFRQVDAGIQRSQEGTGLGLNITKKLVELMGGSILLESQCGKGSTFIVTLPKK